MSLRGYVTALENENKMLRELWSNLGMPEPEYDCLGTEYTHSKKRREDFLRNVYTSDAWKQSEEKETKTKTKA